ncbi:dihydropteroate synthase [Rhizomicrobium sp. SCGC AG-212-E05]|nr:dihydropteroate synthase [Rhizomicrobium sp. SCGC AG-212-E05]
MKILGILNITTDSFSDGGKYLAPEAALTHAQTLADEGADIIDIGAASSNPNAGAVTPELEIARLASVVPTLKAKGLSLSIDSFAPPVQRWALEAGVDYLNDIHGFSEPALYPALAASNVRLIVMHAIQASGIATREDVPPEAIMERITTFFDARLAALERAGIARDRLILDPGMGFFLGTNPQTSLTVLDRLPELKARYSLPLLVSVSRKSFLRSLVNNDETWLDSMTAATEAVAVRRGGADYVRTHAPAALRIALKGLENL